MAPRTISRLIRVPLREVWEHEATDFTPWLRDNLDLLNEVVGLSLTDAKREHPVGDFSVDLVAEDESGNPVAIENQLERSNHDHLGKVLTYLAGVDAKTAIWIVKDPRPEHVKAISWLNESGLADFYLLKVEAVRIDTSPPAPLLTLIVGPSAEAKAAGDTKKEVSERHELRRSFWAGLLERARSRTQLHAGRTTTEQGWLGTSAGIAGFNYDYVIRQHHGNVELYIDFGAGRNDQTLQAYQSLESHREEIERAFGGQLEWEPLEGRRACKISRTVNVGGYRDDENWPAIQDAMIEEMIRLEAAFRPFVSAP